jgi:hypothetical protein
MANSLGKGVRKALGQISEREKELLKKKKKKPGKRLGYPDQELEKRNIWGEPILLKGAKGVLAKKSGKKLTKSIDGRANKGLTRGSRRK